MGLNVLFFVENATYDELDEAEQQLRKSSGVHLTAPLKPVTDQANSLHSPNPSIYLYSALSPNGIPY